MLNFETKGIFRKNEKTNLVKKITTMKNKKSTLQYHNKYFHHAFTLIELLTVIAIIGILAAILIPVVGRVRTSANSAKSASNLRQLGIALNQYISDYGKLTHTRTFDVELAPYLGLKPDSQGFFSLAAEKFFWRSDEGSDPRTDGHPRRSYAQQSQYYGDPKESLEGRRYSEVKSPSMVMIYTERAGPGHGPNTNPGGYVGWNLYTGILLGNHNPKTPNPDWNYRLNGTPGLFNYCFIDGHVETRMWNDKKMIGTRGNENAPKGAWTLTDGD